MGSYLRKTVCVHPAPPILLPAVLRPPVTAWATTDSCREPWEFETLKQLT